MRLSELEEYIKRVASNYNVPYQMNVLNQTCIQYTTTLFNYIKGETYTFVIEAYVKIPSHVNFANMDKNKRNIQVIASTGNLTKNFTLVSSISLMELQNRSLFHKTLTRLIGEPRKAVY